MSLAPEGRRLLRVEARNAEVPVERKPEWIKAKFHMGPEYIGLKNEVKCGCQCMVARLLEEGKATSRIPGQPAPSNKGS